MTRSRFTVWKSHPGERQSPRSHLIAKAIQRLSEGVHSLEEQEFEQLRGVLTKYFSQQT